MKTNIKMTQTIRVGPSKKSNKNMIAVFELFKNVELFAKMGSKKKCDYKLSEAGK